MDELIAIDRDAREVQLDHAGRHRPRQEKAPLLLDQIREHILATSKTVLRFSGTAFIMSNRRGNRPEATGSVFIPELFKNIDTTVYYKGWMCAVRAHG